MEKLQLTDHANSLWDKELRDLFNGIIDDFGLKEPAARCIAIFQHF